MPLSATTPAAPEPERGAEHRADVARVLHRVQHQDHGARGDRDVLQRQTRGSITATIALRLLGVGQLVELGLAHL